MLQRRGAPYLLIAGQPEPGLPLLRLYRQKRGYHQPDSFVEYLAAHQIFRQPVEASRLLHPPCRKLRWPRPSGGEDWFQRYGEAKAGRLTLSIPPIILSFVDGWLMGSPLCPAIATLTPPWSSRTSAQFFANQTVEDVAKTDLWSRSHC